MEELTMKLKKTTAKLVINKSTVANLKESDMNNAKGGWDTAIVCNTLMRCTGADQSCIKF